MWNKLCLVRKFHSTLTTMDLRPVLPGSAISSLSIMDQTKFHPFAFKEQDPKNK